MDNTPLTPTLSDLSGRIGVKLWKDERHDHFWIEDGELYETYSTIRGLRWRFRESVPGMPDINNLTEDAVKYVEETYLTLKTSTNE